MEPVLLYATLMGVAPDACTGKARLVDIMLGGTKSEMSWSTARFPEVVGVDEVVAARLRDADTSVTRPGT